jgi:hypothetical protein
MVEFHDQRLKRMFELRENAIDITKRYKGVNPNMQSMIDIGIVMISVNNELPVLV